MVSEVAISESNPIYLKAFQFSSANIHQIQLKIEIWLSITGKTTPSPKHAKFIGESEFKIDTIMR